MVAVVAQVSGLPIPFEGYVQGEIVSDVGPTRNG